jgi:hypothetical protein
MEVLLGMEVPVKRARIANGVFPFQVYQSVQRAPFPHIVCLLMILFLFGQGESLAKKRFAGPNEGVNLNQLFIPLQDGRFYAERDRKVVGREVLEDPYEAERIRRQLIERIYYFRYGLNGFATETDDLKWHLQGEQKRKDPIHEHVFQELLSEQEGSYRRS